jgi:hypothetical protein
MAPIHLAKPQRELLVVTAWALAVPTALAVLISGAGLTSILALLVPATPIYFLATNLIVDRCGSRPADTPAGRTLPSAGPQVAGPPVRLPGTAAASAAGAPVLPDPQPHPTYRRIA